MAGSLFLSALLALFAVAVTAQDVVPRPAAAAVTSIIDPATQATGAPTSSNDSGSSSSAADSAAGAEGADDGSFKMSKGGMIAIIVVVVVVAVGGIVSTVLFFIAKKRQWEVRKSLKRVSRRLTGRSTVDVARNNREHRRTAVRVASPPPGQNRTAGAQENRNRDLEKGEKKPAGRNQKPTMSAFSVETPVVKSWKDRVFGYKE
ncbi:hypothetical protein MPH_11464 [Macrophomina phaseolina MS6]|uniref:Transmembrane protein n=1 Tax=Macrophomina phaseolina (strain MS6) TaxID=1126212 RepID=K2RMN3_MACPH|nr:hypothetical protein MPH_11464 [Macrophomina phaseolina MS6]